MRNVSKRKIEKVPTTCPCCGCPVALEVDEEYMLSKCGSSYVYMPWREWTFYCIACEEAGPYDELFEIGRTKS